MANSKSVRSFHLSVNLPFSPSQSITNLGATHIQILHHKISNFFQKLGLYVHSNFDLFFSQILWVHLCEPIYLDASNPNNYLCFITLAKHKTVQAPF